MRFLLLIMVMVSGFVVGSEKNDEVTVFHATAVLGNNPLRYCEKEYVDYLNNHYGIQCKHNEPFLEVSYWGSSKNDLIERITLVPFKCFLDKDFSFKKNNAELLSCSRQFTTEKNKFQIQLVTDFEGGNPQDLLDQFKEEPRCKPGNLFDGNGKRLGFVDSTKLEKELCDAGIILLSIQNSYRDGKPKYTQWVNGYFGDDVKVEMKKKFDLVCKILGCCSIAAAILVYIVYKKFYAAA